MISVIMPHPHARFGMADSVLSSDFNPHVLEVRS